MVKVMSRSGKFFSIEFMKLDGTMRKMTCRGKVMHWKTANGGKDKVWGHGYKNDPEVSGVLKIYSTGDKDYRSVVLSNVSVLNAYGATFVLSGKGKMRLSGNKQLSFNL